MEEAFKIMAEADGILVDEMRATIYDMIINTNWGPEHSEDEKPKTPEEALEYVAKMAALDVLSLLFDHVDKIEKLLSSAQTHSLFEKSETKTFD